MSPHHRGESILGIISAASIRRAALVCALLPILSLTCATALAQTAPGSDGISQDASLSLPDAPVPALSPARPADAITNAAKPTPAEASHTQKYIEPGQTAPSITAGDKVLLGLRDSVAPLSALGWLTNAGWEQLANVSPNYGTDRGAFGQRLGAAAIRDVSEGVFCDSILAPILHEDPRYYRMGPSHNFFVRLVYSGTRPILTRTDGGRTSPNFANLGGNLAGSALANTYYPPVNRGTKEIMETFGGSVGGSAIGFVVSEFYKDFTQIFQHK